MLSLYQNLINSNYSFITGYKQNLIKILKLFNVSITLLTDVNKSANLLIHI